MGRGASALTGDLKSHSLHVPVALGIIQPRCANSGVSR